MLFYYFLYEYDDAANDGLQRMQMSHLSTHVNVTSCHVWNTSIKLTIFTRHRGHACTCGSCGVAVIAVVVIAVVVIAVVVIVVVVIVVVAIGGVNVDVAVVAVLL